MFKRIFISLMILSSLAAEGITGLPWYCQGCFYAFIAAVSPEYGATEPVKLLSDKDSESKLFAGVDRLTINRYSGECNKCWCKVFSDQPQARYPAPLLYVYSDGTDIPGFLSDKTMKIQESDVSPPVFSI